MKKFLFLFVILFLPLTGCAQKNEHAHTHTHESSELVDVTILTPEKITVNEEIEIGALVAQGEEYVNDADEVHFEIWKEGEEDHTMYEGELQGDGHYVISAVFPDEGKYFIIAHVTARNMHTMPQIEIIVEHQN